MGLSYLGFGFAMSSVTQMALMLVLFCAAVVAGYFIQNFRTLSGYSHIKRDVREITTSLRHGRMDREKGDLVVRGLYQGLPVTLRFSNDDRSPGVSLRASIPLDLALSVFPKRAQPGPGRTIVSSGNPRFDMRYRIRTDEPQEVKMFLTSRRCLAEIKKLCCSHGTLFAVTPGFLELIEREVPPDPARHLLSHIKSAAVLAQVAAEMPGAARIRVETLPKRGSSSALKLSLGLASLIIGWFVFGLNRGESQITANHEEATNQINTVLRLPGFRGWRLAETGDFDDAFADWLLRSQVPPSSSIHLVTDDPTTKADAYLMAADDGSRRVDIFVGGALLYDSRSIHVAGIAKIPRDQMVGINWAESGESQPMPQGDGLLLVRDANDPASGVILFVSEGRISSGIPADYHNLSLR